MIETSFEEQNMKLIEDRDRLLNFSRTGSQGKGISIMLIIFLSIVLLSAGRAVYTMDLFRAEKVPAFIAVLGISWAVFVALTILKLNQQSEIKIKSPLVYSPKKVANRLLINMIIGALILFAISILAGYGGYSQGSFVGLFVALIFGGLAFFSLIIGAKKITEVHKEGRMFGASKIQLLNKEKVALGSKVLIRFQNEELHKHLSELNITFRNVHERWEPKVNKKGKKRNTYYLFELTQNISLVSNLLEFDFEIPATGVQPTDYKMTAPYYWELIVSNSAHNFFSRFFIEVNP